MLHSQRVCMLIKKRRRARKKKYIKITMTMMKMIMIRRATKESGCRMRVETYYRHQFNDYWSLRSCDVRWETCCGSLSYFLSSLTNHRQMKNFPVNKVIGLERSIRILHSFGAREPFHSLSMMTAHMEMFLISRFSFFVSMLHGKN